MAPAEARGRAGAEGDVAGGRGGQSPNTLKIRIVAKPRPFARAPVRASLYAAAEDAALQQAQGALPRADGALRYTVDVLPGQSPQQCKTIGVGDELVGSEILASGVVRVSFERCPQPPTAPRAGAMRGRRPAASLRGVQRPCDFRDPLTASPREAQETSERGPSPRSLAPSGPEERSGVEAVGARVAASPVAGRRRGAAAPSTPPSRAHGPGARAVSSCSLVFSHCNAGMSLSPEGSLRPRQRPQSAHGGRSEPCTSPGDREFNEWREHLMLEASARARERAVQQAGEWPTAGGPRHVAAAGSLAHAPMPAERPRAASSCAQTPLAARLRLPSRQGAVAGRCSRTPRGLRLGCSSAAARAASGDPAVPRGERVPDEVLRDPEESIWRQAAHQHPEGMFEMAPATDSQQVMYSHPSEAVQAARGQQEARQPAERSPLGDSQERQFAGWSSGVNPGDVGAAHAPPADDVPPIPKGWCVGAKPGAPPG